MKMARKYFTQARSSWCLLQLVALVALQSGALAIYCPLSCICVFDKVLEDNTATCPFGNSTVDISWYKDFDHITLKIDCKDAVRGFQYDCKDIPQFNMSSDSAWLSVRGCAASIMRCVNGVFRAPTKIVQFNSYDMVDPYAAEDLAGLEHVDRARLYLTNEDTEMPAVAANSLSAMTYFIITGGNLQLTSNVFKQTRMEYLQLHLNNIRGLPPDTFNGLPNLKFLEIRGNYFEHLGANAFRGLSAVEDLVIENDTLITIDPDAFSAIRQLTTLYIKNNRLKLIPNGLFTTLENLFKVRITMNQVEMTLDSHVFANLPRSIKVVDVPGSNVRYLPEHLLNGSADVHQLYFNKNQIESLPPKLFATTTGLRYIDLSENRIQNIPDELFSKMKKLEHIDLGYNAISTLRGDIFTHSPDLKEVYLNHNKLTHIDRDIFKGTSLRTLTLAYNKLERIDSTAVLEWQTKKLNLSNNELTVFEDWLINVAGLEDLDLSVNKIKMIKESHIYSFKTKITIDLRNNSITEIFRDTPEPVISIKPGDVTLYLSNNPLQCDCVVTTLLKEWHKYGILADYEQITCENDDKLSKLDIYVQCNKTHAFIALVGSSVVGTLVIIVILISIFTHRLEIWEYVTNIFKSDDSTGIFKTGADNATFEMKEEVKPYDLFISFAHQDGEFVADKLLPILEKDFQLKVCVHYRDWVVGDLIPVQIKESVESSTMTMIILTEHFLESEWSSLEFRTAHDLSIEDGKQRVILVLLRDSVIRHDKLRGDLKSYIDMNTYLLWDDTYFWDKLQKILPKHGKSKLKKKSLK